MSESFDPVQVLSERFKDAIRAAVPDAPSDPDPLISESKRRELGDFQSNAAMPLAKRLGKNPREVAGAIVEHLQIDDLCEPVSPSDIAGPGFINVRLRADALAGLLTHLDTDALGIEPPASPETVVVDLCGVNLAKQMHVGHLRSTVIGDALARLFDRLGHNVIRQSHVGDWGLPIAMVTARLQQESEAGRLDLDALSLDDLDRLYKAAQQECAPDRRGLEAAKRWDMGPKTLAELEEQVGGAEEALAHAKQTLLKLQAHEPETYALWRRIYDVTMGACLAICRRLNADITDEHSAGESTYAEELSGVVEDLLERGVAEESDGAVVVRVEGHEQPCLIRKSDGGYLYATTDLAAIRRRVQELGADRVVYTVDARQSLHFALVFAAALKAGYATRPGADEHSVLQHAAFGTILGEDRRPFKTRSGESVKLAQLVDEAVTRAGATVSEKNPDLSDDERARIAEAVGVAAIKYADLANDRVKDYVFSFDRMLAFEGDTGPYLLYAVVRIESIFRKAQERSISFDPSAPIVIGEPNEKRLALTLLRYPSTVTIAAEYAEPHRLCAYLYELATAFSGFFDACPVLGAEDERVRASRLRLCAMTKRVLVDGLTTLGMPVLDRM